MTDYTTTRDTAVAATLARIDTVIETIGHAAGDAISPDAMRWTPDPPAAPEDGLQGAEPVGTWVDETHRFNHGGPVRPRTPLAYWALQHVQPDQVIETTTAYGPEDRWSITYRRPGSDPVSTVDATWSPPDTAQAAQRLLDDAGADLTPWQRDVLRAAYTPGPDGLPRYRRMYVVPSRRHGLTQLFRRLTRRDR